MKQCSEDLLILPMQADFCPEHGSRGIEAQKCLACGNSYVLLGENYCGSCGNKNPFHLCQVCEGEYALESAIVDSVSQWIGENCKSKIHAE